LAEGVLVKREALDEACGLAERIGAAIGGMNPIAAAVKRDPGY